MSFTEFQEQVNWIVDNGYIIEGFRELEVRLKTCVFPQRYVVLCFDDGHRSDLEAGEYLHRRGAQATFFISTGLVGSATKFLQPRQVTELSKICGIGSHGVTHRSLLELKEEEIISELMESRRWLENHARIPITHVSLPGGSMNRRIIAAARNCGYTLIGGSTEAISKPHLIQNTRVVHRVAVRNGYSVKTVAAILGKNRAWFLRRQFRRALLYVPKLMIKDKTLTSILDRLHKLAGYTNMR